MSRAWPVKRLDPNATLADNARRILAVRVAEFYSYAPVVADESAIDELHDLRIAAKRLRYTLELFRSVFGETGERQIVRVKAIQEDLGQLHDFDVRIALIEEELRVLVAEQLDELHHALATAPVDDHRATITSALRPPPDDPRRGLLALLGRQHTARRERYRAFLTTWQQRQTDGMRRELVGLSSYPVPTQSDALVQETAAVITLPPSPARRNRHARDQTPAAAGTFQPAPTRSGKRRVRSPQS
ncbi:MAG: CHAD domain-containing protein [Thermomicrobiales bacterium]